MQCKRFCTIAYSFGVTPPSHPKVLKVERDRWNATSGRVGSGCGFAARLKIAPSARWASASEKSIHLLNGAWRFAAYFITNRDSVVRGGFPP